ncbi:Subtilase family [Mycoplasmopsis bovigenitalium]|uniref:Subtilase family n=1 Tax=Mycoplasmopsis bovigenitalium TaxID=2112 RepID=A0A449A868_9BACT|nr:S8 family serine peptidase [Mycoplasmopsis bovigenitalium]VEU60449.1 Subtilase family [Mycoplasmopsis bovigenitalium]
MKKLLFNICPVILAPVVLSAKYHEPKDFTSEEYSKIKDIYRPYYLKHAVYYNRDDDYDNDMNNYNKVGIIEVENFDRNYLLSSDQNFHFDNHSKDAQTSDNHGYAVTSIIGTDLGINKNAKLYYSTLPTKGFVDLIKEMHEKHDIKLFNFSFSRKLLWREEGEESLLKYDNNNISMSYELRSFLALAQYLLYELYFIDTSFRNLINKDIDEFYGKVNKYAAENDIKIVKSAGNLSYYDHIDKIKRTKNFFLEKYFTNSNFDFDRLKTDFLETITRENANSQNITYFKKYLTSVKDSPEKLGNFIKNMDQNENILEGINLWSTATNMSSFINVGAVDFNNYPTYFTSFDTKNKDNSPLVSAYGLGIDDDHDKIKHFYKNKYYSEDYELEKTSIDNIINKLHDTERIKKLNYLRHFDGTSKAAPLVTGMLSLLQYKLKRNLSIAEAKTILASSSIYSPIKALNFELFFGHNKSLWLEYWRKNKSKSKTGYGVPKFEKMYDISRNKSFLKLNDFIRGIENQDGNHYINIFTDHDVKHKGRHFTHTISISPTKSFKEYVESNTLFTKWFLGNLEPSNIDNLYDVSGEIKFEYTPNEDGQTSKGSRKHQSTSNNSNTERLYFNLPTDFARGKYNLRFELNELNWYAKQYKFIKYNWLIAAYKDYLKDAVDISSYMEVK